MYYVGSIFDWGSWPKFMSTTNQIQWRLNFLDKKTNVPRLHTDICSTPSDMAWLTINIYINLWDVMICPLHNSYCGLAKPEIRRVIATHRKQWVKGVPVRFNSSPSGQNGRHLGRRHFQKHFLWMKSFVFWLIFHWNLFLRVKLAIFQHWFR